MSNVLCRVRYLIVFAGVFEEFDFAGVFEEFDTRQRRCSIGL